MRMGRCWRKLGLGLLMSAGLVVMQTTDVLAVAGKNVTVMAGTQLANATIEFELSDGTTVTRIADERGQVELPPTVNKDTVRNCYRKDQSSTGEEKRRIECGFWLPTAGTSSSSAVASRSETPFLHRLLDSQFVIQGGYSITNGINSTSRGAFPGGATFLDGSGANTISAPSYNFMLQHPFDRFRPMLGGGAPYVFVQGSKFHGLDADGGIGVSGTGLDRTFLNREISSAFGGGIGFSYPLYCYDGIRGGDKCFEIGAFVGGKGVRQRVSATADEAGNLRSFQDCYTDVVPFGGLTAAAPLFPGVKFVFTYEIIALYSRDLRGTSFFGNTYDYRSDGGTIQNLWGGVSINPGKLLF